MGGDRLMQPVWQGNQLQFKRAQAPAIPAFSYVPEAQPLSILATPEVRGGLLAREIGGPNQSPEHQGPAAASPDMLADSLSSASRAAGVFGGLGGVMGLGLLGSAAASTFGADAMRDAFQDAYGTSGKFSGWDNFANAATFGLAGHDFGQQHGMNAPGISDTGFAPSGVFGSGNHPGERNGGSGGGVGSASGEGPGGSAGMGDSEGAASGTWHKGGLITDNQPQTYRDNYRITAQEGEYVLPRNVVDKLGVGLLDDLLRRFK